MSEETPLWKGSTSQLVHFWTYLLWIVAAIGIAVGGTIAVNPLIYAALIVPFIGIIARWLVTRTTVYELTSQRLRKTSGILNKKLDELELYRVKDSTLEQPVLLRMFGLGNIKVISSDATLPTLTMDAVPGAYDAREKLRVAVEAERDRKRVRDVEFTETDADNTPH
jgi:uncharacterized membrane protein YdbT with pleckstrin-like domain